MVPKRATTQAPPARQIRIANPQFPTWFEHLTEVDPKLGGGWIGLAKVEQLAKMTPKRNPAGRNDRADPRANITGLAQSIEEIGLNQFPVVNDKEVVDGVRRIAALGVMIEEGTAPARVPVLYRPTATPGHFAGIQDHCLPHSPTQKVETFLKDPTAVTPRWKAKCQRAVSEVGRELVEQVTCAGRNILSMLTFARRAFEYTQPDTVTQQEFLRRAVRVQLFHRDQQRLKLWLQNQESPVVLCRKILAEETLSGDE
jgi:hypothetical protein